MRKLSDLLPLEFRILYRQFFLRVIDLEALSVHADIPRFLGQFASVLVFISLIGALGLLFSVDRLAANEYLEFAWRGEQNLISGTMLLVGLVAIVGWDSTFPDRRDVMVLSPLPIAPSIILFAKIAASTSLLGLAVVTLNFASGIAWPLFIGAHRQSGWGVFQALGAYWLTMIGIGVFLYGSVLAIQGLTSLIFPRRVFLVLSAFLQIACFCAFLAVYFLQPTITSRTGIGTAENHWVTWSPSFWFFALFNQLNGSIPVELSWLARRAWISLGLTVTGAIVSLVLCYLATMRKTLEEPDLVPAAHGLHWTPRFGNPLQTAVVLFSFRSIVRSRQHRLAFAFYAALILSMALPWLRIELSSQAPLLVTSDFLASTFIILSLAVLGLRGIFLLPISLTANWVLQTTHLSPTEKYVVATRSTLLLLAVAPSWAVAALLSIRLRPLHYVAIHLVVLALVGWLFVEIGLINFYKVPFTCSWLPGKVHILVLFGCALVLLVVFGLTCSEIELPALGSPTRTICMVLLLVSGCFGLWLFNNRRAWSAQLYFEEPAPEIITSLGIGPLPQQKHSTVLPE